LPHCTIDGTIYWNYRKEWEVLKPLLFFLPQIFRIFLLAEL
jgi:hypothetical protein